MSHSFRAVSVSISHPVHCIASRRNAPSAAGRRSASARRVRIAYNAAYAENPRNHIVSPKRAGPAARRERARPDNPRAQPRAARTRARGGQEEAPPLLPANEGTQSRPVAQLGHRRRTRSAPRAHPEDETHAHRVGCGDRNGAHQAVALRKRLPLLPERHPHAEKLSGR